MMLQEEFSRLIYMFQQAAEGKNIAVQDVFHKSLEFIEHLKEQIQNGDEEDRKAGIRMMNELYEHMKNHTKAICEKAGISEEQLMVNSEDPAQFSEEQWQEMQESKAKLAQSGQQLVQLLHEKDAEQGSPASSTSSHKKDQKKKKAKKSQWMRS